MGDFSERLKARQAEKRQIESIAKMPEGERAKMMFHQVCSHLDAIFNGAGNWADRKVGFCLMTFPFKGEEGAFNYMGNGADRKNVIAVLRAQLAQFEELEQAKEPTN